MSSSSPDEKKAIVTVDATGHVTSIEEAVKQETVQLGKTVFATMPQPTALQVAHGILEQDRDGTIYFREKVDSQRIKLAATKREVSIFMNVLMHFRDGAR